MPNLSLDLRNLRCAFAAAEHGSFRQAAEALDLPQSSVSRRVQALEHRLGFPVFKRSRVGVRLTAAGAAFLEEASAGADQLDFAKRYAAALHRGHRGGIRIGVSQLRIGGLLREALRCFRESFPATVITLIEDVPSKIRQAVVSGGLDVAFATGAVDVPGCLTRELWREKVFVVLPDAHLLADRDMIEWSDIRDETFVLSSRGQGAEADECLVARLGDVDHKPRVDIHDVPESSIFDLVNLGYGITLVYASVVRDGIDGVTFRRLAGEAGTLPSCAVWPVEETSLAVPNLLAIAEAIGRGEVPAAPLGARSHGLTPHDCAAVPDRTDRRERANSRSVAMKRSSIGAMRRVGSDTG